MLVSGDIDALISAREPAAFTSGDPAVQRLWPEFQPVEEQYYRETGIFPIMHVIVVRATVLERAPWVAMNLLHAFEQAKANSLSRLGTIVNSAVPLPWIYSAFARARNAFGADVWPYGVDSNRHTLEAFLRFCREQGVAGRQLSVEELFPREVQSMVKV